MVLMIHFVKYTTEEKNDVTKRKYVKNDKQLRHIHKL